MVGYATFCLAIGLVNVSYATVVDVREFRMVEVASGSNVCALDEPSESLSLNSVLDCALECQRFSYCKNLNFDNVNKTCDIFFDRPKCYGPSAYCIHYQVTNYQIII